MEKISNSLTLTSIPHFALFIRLYLKFSPLWGQIIVMLTISYEHKLIWASIKMPYDWQHSKMKPEGSHNSLCLSFILMIFRLWELLLHYCQRNYNIIVPRDLLPQIFTGIDHKIDFFRLLPLDINTQEIH